MSKQHLYSIKLKGEGSITQQDERELEEYTVYLKSGEATVLNGEIKVNPDDLIDVHEIPNPDMQNVG